MPLREKKPIMTIFQKVKVPKIEKKVMKTIQRLYEDVQTMHHLNLPSMQWSKINWIPVLLIITQKANVYMCGQKQKET